MKGVKRMYQEDTRILRERQDIDDLIFGETPADRTVSER